MRPSAFHFDERHPRDEHHNVSHTSSPREGSYSNGGQYGGSRYDFPYRNNNSKIHAQSPHRGHGYGAQYPPHYSPHTPLPRQLRSVVTTSFSLEDDRDDPNRGMGRRMMHDRMVGIERRNELPAIERRNDIASVERRNDIASVERRNDYSEREDNTSIDRDNYFAHAPYEPHAPQVQRAPSNSSDFINRSFSSGSASFKSAAEPLKRSYYHHSRPNEVQTGGQLPPDFMPPKRMKLKEQVRGEVIVTPRSPTGSEGVRPCEWLGRGATWESTDDEPYNRVSRNQSFPPQHHSWSKPQTSPLNVRNDEHKVHVHVSPANDSETPPRVWHGHARSASSDWMSTPRPPVSQYRSWDSPEPEHIHRGRWNSPELEHSYHSRAESKGHMPQHHSMSIKNRESSYYQQGQILPEGRSGSTGKMHMVVDAAAGEQREHRDRVSGTSTEGLCLLALPQDRVALSETLCVVRENIEVFTATQSDVDAPAPGRKHAVVVGQVGLRCIHCRHTTKCSDRIKRAVCYPSSIKRIYRTVIDMKLDHFSQCRFVPDELKNRLQQLKAVQTRSTGTTMQYFIRAAHALGMEDGPSGVRFRERPNALTSEETKAQEAEPTKPEPATPMGTVVIHRTGSESTNVTMDTGVSKRSDSMMSTESFDSTGSPESVVSLDKYYEGRIPLALPEDKASLSPLRCFLREQVCAFSATEEDIAVRAPTTFSITAGQVGIGCIHCLKEPPKLRSNRAVCFPFSIGRIYQSVADIQRFHFTECKMLPLDVKEKFLELQSASSKGSKGLATRQYWVTSAKKIGLVDTQRGIRFGRDPTKPEEGKAFSLDILAQAAFTVTTANKQLVIEDDKDTIAEFLYVVMEQLQPCRFTEADRNKRRLKDVGCIGVECKHCAGQVDGRKFFWSSVSAVESNFVSVHTHMLECKMVPPSLKDKLSDLKKLRKQQTAALKTGSQKAFFSRVWKRLHDEEVALQQAASREKALSERPSENRVGHQGEKQGWLSEPRSENRVERQGESRDDHQGESRDEHQGESRLEHRESRLVHQGENQDWLNEHRSENRVEHRREEGRADASNLSAESPNQHTAPQDIDMKPESEKLDESDAPTQENEARTEAKTPDESEDLNMVSV